MGYSYDYYYYYGKDLRSRPVEYFYDAKGFKVQKPFQRVEDIYDVHGFFVKPGSSFLDDTGWTDYGRPYYELGSGTRTTPKIIW